MSFSLNNILGYYETPYNTKFYVERQHANQNHHYSRPEWPKADTPPERVAALIPHSANGERIFSPRLIKTLDS